MVDPGSPTGIAKPASAKQGNPSRASRIPLWVWPALATVAVAVTSQLLGAWAAAIGIVALLVVAAANLLGMNSERPRWWAVSVATIGGVLAVGALVFTKPSIDTITSPKSTTSPATAAGQPLRGKNLQGSDYSKQSLARADLRGADLRGANLSGADLSYATLNGADLRGADLHDACLRHADLTGANLSGADFTGADVRDATMRPPTDATPATWPPTPSSQVTCQG